MKRVLLVARFYPPWAGGGVYRTLGFVRHLREFGYEPVVLTGPATGAWVKDPGLLEGVGDLEVVRAGGAGPAGLGAGEAGRPAWASALAALAPWVAIPDAYRSWRAPAVKAGLAQLKADGFHAIYSTSPPDTCHLAALDLHRATGLPWIADFRDPWIGLGYREPPTRWHRAAHGRMLHSVLAFAAHVVAATEGTRRWLARADPSLAARSSVIPNGYEEDEWREVAPERFEKFTVLHAGRLSGDRDLEDFLKGFELFLSRFPDRRARAQCLLLGPHDDLPVRRVRERGMQDVVRFMGQVSHRKALEMEAGAHALLLV